MQSKTDLCFNTQSLEGPGNTCCQGKKKKSVFGFLHLTK